VGHVVRLEQLPARPLAVVRRRAPSHEISKVVPAACGTVWNVLRSQQVSRAGRQVAVYLDGQVVIGLQPLPHLAVRQIDPEEFPVPDQRLFAAGEEMEEIRPEVGPRQPFQLVARQGLPQIQDTERAAAFSWVNSLHCTHATHTTPGTSRGVPRGAKTRDRGFLVEGEIGLGDAMKRITYAVGMKPCLGCERRAAALNRWVRFSG
jgi:hypothetical protein